MPRTSRAVLVVPLAVMAVTAALIAPAVAAAGGKQQPGPSVNWVPGTAQAVTNGGCSVRVSAQLHHTVRALAQATLQVIPEQSEHMTFTGKGTDTFTWTFTQPAGQSGSVLLHAQTQSNGDYDNVTVGTGIC